jgi:RimJ/RimL family protein N-acetyltransferase
VLKFGFEKLGLERIFATCYEDNVGSVKVLMKNGMARESKNDSVLQFGLAREEYEKTSSLNFS